MHTFFANYTTNPHAIHTLADLIHYTRHTPGEQAAQYPMATWEKCEKLAQTYTTESAAYKTSLAYSNRIGRQIPRLLDDTGADLLVVPASLDTSANVGGYPTVCVPLGFFPGNHGVRRGVGGLVEEGPGVP